MLLIIIYFLKNLLHINLAPHPKAGYNRTLQTENNALSIKILDLQPIKRGVPQGSVLGPVVFLLVVNDLPLLFEEAYLDLYADDATVHASGKQQKTVELKLQTSTDDFKNWCLSINMFIHIGKTSLMTAWSPQNIGHIKMEAFIDGEIIKEVARKPKTPRDYYR